MREALQEAKAAAALGEVPVGCVLVRQGKVIARGRNERERSGDPTAHAELLAIRRGALSLGDWRLAGCDLYVTLEPCAMCAGALVLARIDRLIFGCSDPKAGAVVSLFNIGIDPRLNHRFEMTNGVLAESCAEPLRSFFGKLRASGHK